MHCTPRIQVANLKAELNKRDAAVASGSRKDDLIEQLYALIQQQRTKSIHDDENGNDGGGDRCEGEPSSSSVDDWPQAEIGSAAQAPSVPWAASRAAVAPAVRAKAQETDSVSLKNAAGAANASSRSETPSPPPQRMPTEDSRMVFHDVSTLSGDPTDEVRFACWTGSRLLCKVSRV